MSSINKKKYEKQYRKNHPEVQKKADKKYYKNHREERLRKNKLWHENNPEKVRECARRCYKKSHKYINDYKLSKGCKFCGYNKCAEALDFHHPNDDKEFNIGSYVSYSLEKLKKEMEKCEILCCRCHRELHDKERKNND